MDEMILLGQGSQILTQPAAAWRQSLAQIPQHSQARLRFMTDAHHQVRYFVVQELVHRQKPVAPELIAETLKLPLAHVQAILAELETELFFLVRNAQNDVVWAYPVTFEPTSHRLRFSTGEVLYGA